MAIEAAYSDVRANFAAYLEQVTGDREVVIINRRGHEPVALVSAAELAGLLETAHLLRSPRNAERLLLALARARRNEGEAEELVKLKQELGIGEEE